MEQKITHRDTGKTIFTCKIPAKIDGGVAFRYALEKAVKDRVNLTGANLTHVNLAHVNLTHVNLAHANLAGSYLAGGLELIGKRPVFQIGPIGSRSNYFVAYVTDQGLRVTAGCFKQKTIEEFRAKLIEEHNTNIHRQEYEAALNLFEMHAEIWTPKKVEA